MALTDNLKSEIRALYAQLQQTVPGFKPRKAQGLLIAETSRTLAGEPEHPPLLVAEAGTGTGKTFGYLVPSIPIAKALEATVVVSSATVTLQQQLEQDLALLKQCLPDLKYTTAFGRGRYFCRLAAERVSGGGDAMDDLFGGSKQPLHPSEHEKLAEMVQLFDEGKWKSGLRDNCPVGAVSDALWREVRCERHTCSGPRCAFYRDCALFRARREISDAHVVISNHNLLVANTLNEANILPPMNEALVIFDEAHELPEVFRDGFAARCYLGRQDWLRQLSKLANQANALHQQEASGDADIPTLLERGRSAEEQVKQLNFILQANSDQFNRRGDTALWRFEHGRLPGALLEPVAQLKTLAQQLLKGIKWHQRALEDALEEELTQAGEAERPLNQLGRMVTELDDFAKCWRLLETEEFGGAPLAKWAECGADQQFLLQAVPVSVAGPMAKSLWQDARGCLLTSATLTSLNSFNRFLRQAGIFDDKVRAFRLPSPFNYTEQAVLRVPAMAVPPTLANEEAHTRELAEIVQDAMTRNPDQGGLVLFQSYRQMELFRRLSDRWSKVHSRDLLFQGDDSRSGLLRTHRERIERQRRSVLIGVASLGLGLNLPGRQAGWVVIAKLPFPDFSAPLEAAEQEWVASRPGGNPFWELSLSACSTALCQQAGRLIRSESDSGELIICDTRLREKRYGRDLLASLPPFKRVE